MAIPDPDKDILDKLDRRERRAALMAGALACAGALAAASAA
jgi:hypothetical protein